MEKRFQQTVSSLLDRIMPMPIVLTSCVAVYESANRGLTAALAVALIGLNIALNERVKRSASSGSGKTYGGLRMLIGQVLVPAITWSTGAVASGWLVAIPTAMAIPVFTNRRSLPSTLLLVTTTASAAALAGATPHTLATLVGVLITITLFAAPLTDALKHSFDESVHARAAAERALNARNRFFASMSHELRTPLNAILGMGELLGESDLSETQRAFVSDIGNSGKVLLRLVDDVLDLSKMDAGRLELHPEPTELRALVTEVVHLMSPAATSAHLSLHVQDNLETHWVRLDPIRVKQILLNLVSNAIKFTREGSVTVSAGYDQGEVCLVVEDTGPGLAEDAVQKLFEPYAQVDSSPHRRAQGTGLGLVVCRGLVEAMAGTLVFDSEPGRGTRVSVRFPALPAEREDTTTGQRKATTDLPLLGKSVLVVEDNAVNQRLMCALLKRLGCEFDIANDGAEGVEAATHREYDVILMDMQMPVMDGLEATSAIRADGPNQTTPIIAVTANVDDALSADAEAVGISDILTKPIKRTSLVQLIRRRTKADASPVPPQSSPQTASEQAHAAPKKEHVA